MALFWGDVLRKYLFLTVPNHGVLIWHEGTLTRFYLCSRHKITGSDLVLKANI